MIYISDRFVEEIKTHILPSITFFSPQVVPFVEMVWKNMVDTDMSQTTVQRMHYAYWLTKATDIHSEYVILIAVPLQQWLHERTTFLRLYVHWYLVTELILRILRF